MITPLKPAIAETRSTAATSHWGRVAALLFPGAGRGERGEA